MIYRRKKIFAQTLGWIHMVPLLHFRMKFYIYFHCKTFWQINLISEDLNPSCVHRWFSGQAFMMGDQVIWRIPGHWWIQYYMLHWYHQQRNTDIFNKNQHYNFNCTTNQATNSLIVCSGINISWNQWHHRWNSRSKLANNWNRWLYCSQRESYPKRNRGTVTEHIFQKKIQSAAFHHFYMFQAKNFSQSFVFISGS